MPQQVPKAPSACHLLPEMRTRCWYRGWSTVRAPPRPPHQPHSSVSNLKSWLEVRLTRYLGSPGRSGILDEVESQPLGLIPPIFALKELETMRNKPRSACQLPLKEVVMSFPKPVPR